MRNITLSADEQLIAAGRAEAAARNTTLNQLFRDWLSELCRQRDVREKAVVSNTLDRLETQLRFDQKVTRDEMNQR
ncbi:MAG: hypothetical protein NT069_35050 [Planctomycetota bacterium]|nr:hypothetical protein [Planctomycetota bacterium]